MGEMYRSLGWEGFRAVHRMKEGAGVSWWSQDSAPPGSLSFPLMSAHSHWSQSLLLQTGLFHLVGENSRLDTPTLHLSGLGSPKESRLQGKSLGAVLYLGDDLKRHEGVGK